MVVGFKKVACFRQDIAKKNCSLDDKQQTLTTWVKDYGYGV
jgi:hypothetical protein